RGVLGDVVDVVPVAGQDHRVGTVVIRRRAELFGLLVGQAGAMVVVDVPIDLAEVALVVQVHAGRAVAARLESQVVGDGDRLLDIGRGDIAIGHAIRAGRTTEVLDGLLFIRA